MAYLSEHNFGELPTFHDGKNRWTQHLLEECYILAYSKSFLYSPKGEHELEEYHSCLRAFKVQLHNIISTYLSASCDYSEIWNLAHKFQGELLKNWSVC